MAADIEAVKKEAILYANEVRRQLPVYSAYLFGSYVKGNADKLSDVDICFFLRNFEGRDRVDIGIQLLRIARGFSAYFEPLVFEREDIERKNPFVNEILKTGLEI